MINKLNSVHHRTPLLGLLLFVLLPAAGMVAQESLITVAAKVDKAQITIGERVLYTLVIDRDQSLMIQTPGHGTNLGMFEIKDYKFHDPLKKAGRVVETFEYTISAYDTGHIEIPPFPIGFKLPEEDAKFQFISSEAIRIYVKSVLNAEDVDIRDIKPPFPVPLDLIKLLLIGLGILITLGVIAFLIWSRRNRESGRPVFRKQVIRPAYEIALEELDKLIGSDLLKNEAYRPFYIELSNILRRYLENRFHINAMEETTTEILDSLQGCDLREREIDLAWAALNRCDLVKFAKYTPGQSETNETVGFIRQFIETTGLSFAPVEQLVSEAAAEQRGTQE